MEMDNIFILKQFVAIDELKPSSISSAMDEFCEVYARAVLKLLFLLTEEENIYGVPQREYFFNPKNRAVFGSLERSKYIISLKFFVSRHIFLQQKYAFYLITPNFSIDLTLQKHKKGTIARAL